MNKKNGLSDLSVILKPLAMFLVLLVIWVIFHIVTDGTFLSVRNISNLFRQMAVVGVLSIGMTICLIGGNFDLSVASIAGFTGAVCAVLVAKFSVNPLLAIGAAVLTGALIGFWNGVWIAYAGVPAFIVTLGSQLIFKGCLLLICNGQSIAVRDELFLTLGQGYMPILLGTVVCVAGAGIYIVLDIRRMKQQKKLHVIESIGGTDIARWAMTAVIVGVFIMAMNCYKGIPIPVFVLLLLVVGFSFLLGKTKFGRHVYAIGGNARSARLSGINGARVTLMIFSLVGMLSGIAGVLTTTRLAAATQNAALGMELDAIAASVIGGVSLAGGSGKIANSILGALVMASLTNGMSLLDINSDIQFIVRGLILIIAVWVDVRMRKDNG